MAKLDLKKIKAAAEEAAKTGRDVGVQTAGGDYTPPAAGKTRLRFIEYVEVGVHTKRSKLYGDKTKPMAQFGFELSGPKHPPREFEGKKFPTVIRFEEPIGYGKKNNYSKLFKLMAVDFPGAKNFGQLLGEGFRGEVFHREWKSGDRTNIAAELKGETGYSIGSKVYENEEGEAVTLKIDQPLSDYRYFDWAEGDIDQWESLYIGGQYDDGNTKNKVQEKIKSAENFIGSPIYNALIEAGRDEEVEAAEVFERGAKEDGEQEAPEKAPESPQETPKPEVKGKVAPAKKTAPAPAKAVAKPKVKAKPPVDDPDETDGDDPLAGV